MSEQKHTRLPWYAEPHGNGSDVLVSTDDFQVAVALAHPDPSEAAANAALIVRAVNSREQLVAALRGLLSVCPIAVKVNHEPEFHAARDALKLAGAA